MLRTVWFLAVVRERERGTLNAWLVENGYLALEKTEDVLDFYRDQGSVFACVRGPAAGVYGD